MKWENDQNPVQDVLLTDEGKKALLAALNERFAFHKDGTMTPRNEKAHKPIILSEYLENDDTEIN